MSRLTLRFIVLPALTFALGCDSELPPTFASTSAAAQGTGDQTSTKAQVDKALEIGKDDPAKAISILETALKSAPKDRQALLLLGVISVVQGEGTKEKTERTNLFHKAYGAFSTLKENYKDLNPAEKGFEPRIMLGETRALTLEGKLKEAFGIIKGLMATGNSDFDSIEMVDDLKPLSDLPEFRELVDSTYAPKLADAMKEVATELGTAKSFPFDFKLKDLDDKPVTLGDYRGKLTIVDLWGTWCPPCRREIPHFVALSKKYKQKGLEIVGINCNEEGSDSEIKKTIREFAKAYQIDYKCVIGDDTVPTKIPGFQGFPTTLFIDASGKVRLVFFHAEPKAKLEAAIVTLLAESPQAP